MIKRLKIELNQFLKQITFKMLTLESELIPHKIIPSTIIIITRFKFIWPSK